MKWSATFVRRTALLGMVGCLLSGSPAQTQVAGIVGTLGTGMIVDKIGDKLNSLIDKARTSADFLAMRAAQEALYVLDAFKATNQELLDDAFDRIGEERQAILNAINTTVTEIEAGRVDTLERLQATTDQIDRLARTVTFRSYPVIFRYRGSIVTPGETGDIRIAVDGSNLNKGVSHLKFQDKKYDAKVEGEMLRFDIPRAAFAPDDKSMKSEDAELVLEYRHGGIFGYGQTVEEVKYHLNVITLPKQLAVVEAAYNEFVMIPGRGPSRSRLRTIPAVVHGTVCRLHIHHRQPIAGSIPTIPALLPEAATAVVNLDLSASGMSAFPSRFAPEEAPSTRTTASATRMSPTSKSGRNGIRSRGPSQAN